MRRRLQNVVGPPQLSVLPPQTLQLGQLLARRPPPAARIHLGSAHPLAHRLSGRPQLVGNRTDRLPLRPVLVLMVQDHPHRTLPQPTRISPMSSHDPILLKDRSLHQTRGGSPPTRGMPNTRGEAHTQPPRRPAMRHGMNPAEISINNSETPQNRPMIRGNRPAVPRAQPAPRPPLPHPPGGDVRGARGHDRPRRPHHLRPTGTSHGRYTSRGDTPPLRINHRDRCGWDPLVPPSVPRRQRCRRPKRERSDRGRRDGSGLPESRRPSRLPR